MEWKSNYYEKTETKCGIFCQVSRTMSMIKVKYLVVVVAVVSDESALLSELLFTQTDFAVRQMPSDLNSVSM